MIGPDGPLAEYGLVPAPDAERRKAAGGREGREDDVILRSSTTDGPGSSAARTVTPTADLQCGVTMYGKCGPRRDGAATEASEGVDLHHRSRVARRRPFSPSLLALARPGNCQSVARMHSRPGYYGTYLAIWTVLPAFLVTLLWAAAQPTVVRH